ncbi:hypothetical protein [Nonomuraea wenchangensis]|uniref:hypothetical protein n=1 Tax=Nonomuraea wenchangensis TaxID=568860 RepID=UPI0033241908
MHALGHATRLDEGLELRLYACPGCGRLHTADVVRREAAHLDDIRLLDAEV